MAPIQLIMFLFLLLLLLLLHLLLHLLLLFLLLNPLLLLLLLSQVIAAEGEQKASKALREASMVMAESSSALQLRYLQVIIITVINIIIISRHA